MNLAKNNLLKKNSNPPFNKNKNKCSLSKVKKAKGLNSES